MSIVVTGLGIVSPLGVGTEQFWSALISGVVAIRGSRSEAGPRLAAEVGELSARDFLPAARLRRMDRLSRMIAVAGTMAVQDAKLRDAAGEELGVVVGSAFGNLAESAQFLERAFQKPALANPMLFPNLVLNAPASQLAITLAWRGPNLAVSAAEVSGEAALEAGVDLLSRGHARAVVVAAGDELAAVLHRALADFGWPSPRGEEREWSSPFDRRANGPVLGEGAAAVVLERHTDAERRGITIRAAIESVRQLSLAAAGPHVWPERAEPLAVEAAAPDVLFSGADSSPERDRLELELLSRHHGLPVYSWKGAVGEYSSAGLTGIVAAILALSSGELPPLAALEEPREDADLSFPKERLCGDWRRALLVGTARGGQGYAIRLARPS